METIESIGKKITGSNLIFDYNAALKRLAYTQDDVDKVRKLAMEYEIVPKFLLNSIILMFLNYCNGDHQKAAERLQNYYKFKKEVPEFFSNRHPDSSEVVQALENQNIVAFPITPDGCNLIGGSLRNSDPKNYVFDNTTKSLIMISEAFFLMNGPYRDIIYMISLKDVHFWHILRPSISSIRKSLHFLENAVPVNVKAIYVFNTLPIIKYMIALAKPFISTGLLSKLHIFTSDINWEEFNKNHVPASHLPSDFNGNLPTLKELNENSKKMLQDFKEYFAMETEQVWGKHDHLAEEAKLQKW